MQALDEQRRASSRNAGLHDTLVAVQKLDTAFLQTQAGLRGYLLAGGTGLLKPWVQAREALVPAESDLLRAAATSGDEPQASGLVARVRTLVGGPQVRLAVLHRADPAAGVRLFRSGEVTRQEGEVQRLVGQLEASLGARGDATRREVRATTDRLAVTAISSSGTVIAIVLLLSALMARRVVVAAKALHRGALLVETAIAETGSPGHVRAEVGGRDELAAVARAFNSMVDRVDEGQERAREAWDMQEAILSACPLPVTTSDTVGRLLSFNLAAARFFGWDESMLGTRPEDDPEAMDDLLARVTSGEGAVQMAEFRRRGFDGLLRELVAFAAPLRDPAGDVIGFVVIGTDVTEERRQRFRLHEALELFESVFVNAPDGVALASAEPEFASRRWLKVNPAFCRMLGYTEEELLEVVPIDILHPDDRAAVVADAERMVLEGNGRLSRMRRMVRKDGTSFWASGNASVIYGVDGSPLHIIVQYTDLSEVREATEALAASERNYRVLADTTTDIIVRSAADGTRLYISPACRALLGYEPDELAAIPPEAVVHPDDLDPLEQALVGVAAGEKTTAEYRLRHRDGHWCWFEATIAGRHAGDGTLIERVSVLRPIDERKEAELALRRFATELELRNRELLEVGEQLRRTFEHSPIPEVITDLGGRFLNVNPATELLLGRSRAELVTMSIEDVTHPDDRGRLVERRTSMLRAGETVAQIEIRRLHADGHEIPVMSTASMLHDADGAPSGYVVQWVDLSERKRAEREQRALEASLHEAQRLESLGTLAGGIAHDFNNLLSAVLLASEMLLRKAGDEEQRGLATTIKTAGERAAELSREMLAYSGRSAFVVAPVSLNDVVRDLAEITKVALPRNAVLRTTLDHDLPAAMGDSAQLHQIVLNLITNAAEALPDGVGTITITTGAVEADEAYLTAFEFDPLAPGRYVYVEVGDTGCGIDDATLTRIFDPFFTTKATGRGLGLAAVLGIVRGHRGGIKVHSEPGVGTSFKVILPAAGDAPAAAADARDAAFADQALALLLADDEDLVRTSVRLLLEDDGHSVVAVESGDAAVQAFIEHPGAFDAVILDLTMPGLAGDEAAAIIRAIAPGTPVVIMSGFGSTVMSSPLIREGHAAYVAKPFTLPALLGAIERARSSAAAAAAEVAEGDDPRPGGPGSATNG